MKIAIEHIFGLAPLVAIAIIFKNDDVMRLYYFKQYIAIMGTISTFALII